jgi:DNA-binding NarL/FixJ family response regulator
MMRVLLADDHRLLAEGLCNLLAAHEIEVVGVAVDGLEAVGLAETLHPDLILMDIRMPRCDGLEATRRVKARQPEVNIVMLSTSVDEADLFEAIKSGACGYLLKSMSGTDFIDALRGLEQGAPPFSPGLASMLLNEFARLSKTGTGETSVIPPPALSVEPQTAEPAGSPCLTDRQTDVLRLVAAGLTYKEVGVRLAISERTVRYHMAEIMQRLHLEHRSQVIAYAGKLGLKDRD